MDGFAGLRGSGIHKSIIFGIVVARYIALPLVGVAIVKGAARFGFIHADDALYQFVLLLQFAVPPAMNIGIIDNLMFHNLARPHVKKSSYNERESFYYKCLLTIKADMNCILHCRK